MLLAGLSLENSQCSMVLLRHFPAFVSTYYAALEPLQSTVSDNLALSDTESNVLSRAYISLKLWLLLVQKSPRANENEGRITESSTYIVVQGYRMVWNELWPPFEAVVMGMLHNNNAANSLVSANTYLIEVFICIPLYVSS